MFISFDAATQQCVCQGDWNLNQFSSIENELTHLSLPAKKDISVNGKSIRSMDSAVASLLIDWKNTCEKKGISLHWQDFSKEQTELLEFVQKEMQKKTALPSVKVLPWLPAVGKMTLLQWRELKEYLAFIGLLTMDALRIIRKPERFRWASLASVIYANGYRALLIIALLSYMIGVVIAYQMGVQLRNYGANIYIVDFLGLSILREFGPLLTAIMLAGRTGSSYTAQLGLMKINREIDALNTMGVTPSDLLILPRIIGLFIALPLLTVWANMFGILGGMVMANNMLDITWYDFAHRFEQVIPLRALLIGMGKAPVFALIISSIGCFQGMKVEGSAESVGRNTTKSVVLAIFFIIVVDAIFSVILSKLKL